MGPNLVRAIPVLFVVALGVPEGIRQWRRLKGLHRSWYEDRTTYNVTTNSIFGSNPLGRLVFAEGAAIMSLGVFITVGIGGVATVAGAIISGVGRLLLVPRFTLIWLDPQWTRPKWMRDVDSHRLSRT